MNNISTEDRITMVGFHKVQAKEIRLRSIINQYEEDCSHSREQFLSSLEKSRKDFAAGNYYDAWALGEEAHALVHSS